MAGVGDVVITRMPATAGNTGKLRPALIVHELRALVPSFLVCGISSGLGDYIEGLDVVLDPEAEEFAGAGLQTVSIARPTWITTYPVTSEYDVIGSVPAAICDILRSRLAQELS
jgi:PemK-like, MazF-like toxin of type II toxin-antitoxin system